MSSSTLKDLARNQTPDQLRSLVLNYLCHGYYTRTAKAFSRDSSGRQLDADGDIILGSPSSSITGIADLKKLLNQVEIRQEIRTKILSGQIDDAITSLNAHFPAVLSEPSTADLEPAFSQPADPGIPPTATDIEYLSSTSTDPSHLLLNLRILAFCEACRTVPLPYPPPTTEAPTKETTLTAIKPSTSEEDDPEYLQQQTALLTRARKLYAFTNTLSNPQHRATYHKELEVVAGLLAYTIPEESPMAKYLTLERREAVADQINRAILKKSGLPLISSLELLVRHLSLVWEYAHQFGVKARPDSVVPPKAGKGTATSHEGENVTVPLFDLRHFLDSKP